MKNLKLITVLFCFATNLSGTLAQQKHDFFKKSHPISRGYQKPTLAESAINGFCGSVYDAYYKPSSKRYLKTTYTMLKVGIDWNGKVFDISFSDSADSTFSNIYKNSGSFKRDTALLNNYAKLQRLKDVSLLFPIIYIYEPENSITYSYKQLQNIMKFGKIEFSGQSILFKNIQITILAEGNM